MNEDPSLLRLHVKSAEGIIESASSMLQLCSLCSCVLVWLHRLQLSLRSLIYWHCPLSLKSSPKSIFVPEVSGQLAP